MKYRRYFIGFVFALFLCAAFPLWAQRTVTIRLASMVPENTPWGAALNRMASEWSRVTNGEVEVILFHNGVAGDEAEVLRKMRINQIQAGVFTSIGLNDVMPEIMTLSYPMLIHNDEELDLVLRRLRPELDVIIERSGYVTLAWARAGWVKIFSKAPVFTPADLRRQKLGTNPDELRMMQAFRAMGFQMIPVSLNDVLVSLNGGMIDAIYQSPVAAAAGQIFGPARHMSTIDVAPFMGGIIINSATWRRIPERHRPRLLEISKRVEADIDGSFAALEAEAIATMERHGLIINRASAQQIQEWRDEMARYESELVGPIFNAEIYRRITAILNEHRRGNR